MLWPETLYVSRLLTARLSAAIHSGDMTRAESMLLAQAHTLDLLFAKLASQALSANCLHDMDGYLRLALKLWMPSALHSAMKAEITRITAPRMKSPFRGDTAVASLCCELLMLFLSWAGL